MSVFDQIRKLDEEKQKLVQQAKTEALKAAESAIAELNALGFNYSLVEGKGTRPTSGKRRTGIRLEVLNIIKQNPKGIARAGILDGLSAKGDNAAEQSVSNALSALKKAGTITAKDGLYKVVA